MLPQISPFNWMLVIVLVFFSFMLMMIIINSFYFIVMSDMKSHFMEYKEDDVFMSI